MNGNGLDDEGYTQHQRQQLELAKRTHKETTASAQRALQARCKYSRLHLCTTEYFLSMSLGQMTQSEIIFL